MSVPNDFGLAGSTVLITGASRGIGAACARACARAGAKLALTARHSEGLEAVAAEIRAGGGTALIAPCHMGKPDAVAALFAHVVQELGPLHGIVNNAATNPYFGPLIDAPDGAFDKTI